MINCWWLVCWIQATESNLS